MTPTEQDNELREAILLEFKNVHRLAPADYTENCTNIVMSLVEAYITTLQRQHERELVGKVIKPHSTIPVETFGKKDYVSLDWIVAQLTINQNHPCY